MRHVIITPSYGPDYERCELLANSVKEFVPETVEHILLVDRKDVSKFRPLAGPRTRVMEAESVLPRWVRRIPGVRRWWFSMKTLPIRNWVLQQVVKLAVGELIDSDAYIFIDSDVTLIRPFDPADFVRPPDLSRLYRVSGGGQIPSHFPWHQTAARLLGLPPTDYFGANYIGNLITWRRSNLQQLYRRIEATAKRGWMEAVCSQWHLSEYILYGVFVEHVLGGADQYYDDQSFCHISWGYDISTSAGLDRFFQETQPEHVAVMVSSKDGVPASQYAAAMRQLGR